MREPADLETPQRATYNARKQAIAYTRARIADVLYEAYASEKRGEVLRATLLVRRVALLVDDLDALLTEWSLERYGPLPEVDSGPALT